MRILHVIPFFTPEMGGSAQVVYQMARHLSERGHQVTVLTSDYGMRRSGFASGQFEVVALRTAVARWGFYVMPGLPRWAARNLSRFDVIHLHETRTFHNAVISRFAVRRGIPYVLSAHGTLPIIVQRQAAKRAYDCLAGRSLLDSATRLIAVSEAEVEQYRQAGIEPERIRVVHNGLDLREYARLPERGRFRSRYPSLGPDTKLVLYLGRMHQQKGLDHLLEAFVLLHAQEHASMLVFAGPDHGARPGLEASATRRGLKERVLFAGPLYGQDKLAALVDADVLVSPAGYEIFGLAPFEALMCGTPVVGTADTGAGLLMRDAGAGYLAPFGDARALAATLLRCVTDRAGAMQLVRAGQKFVSSRLSCAAVTDALEMVYQFDGG